MARFCGVARAPQGAQGRGQSGMVMQRREPGGLVYSTDAGRMCPGCRQPVAACTCQRKPGTAPATQGMVRISRETKGRGGKAVTVIRGVPLAAPGLAEFAKTLRAACGAGGTVKDGVIEVQGDHVERVMPLLQAQGWDVKRSGG
jgi:translation initiation factor 1